MEAPRFAILIPAYQPSAALVDLVSALATAGATTVVVDDGSGPEYAATFARAAAVPGVHLLRHAVNLGKGAALKTGINSALCAFPALEGIVTADAGGQHHPDDIARVAAALERRPGALIMGTRTLPAGFGNMLKRGIMHALVGSKLADTETGLRGIPAALFGRLLRIEAAGYGFELEMLLAAQQLAVAIVEEPIRTIGEPGNQSSHFNPLVDSMKAYFVLLRFGSISFVTALLDNLVFYLAYRASGLILIPLMLGRAVAVGFNYSMVRGAASCSRKRHRTALLKYLALLVVSGAASYAGIRALSAGLHVGVVPAKLLVESFLFFINFAVQRMFIFNSASAEQREPMLTPRPLALLAGMAFAALAALEVYGLATGRLFEQRIWFPNGLARLARFGGAYLAFAVPVLLVVPWSFAALVPAALVGLTAVVTGVRAPLAVIFFLLSASALGSRLLGRAKRDDLESGVCAMLLGTSVYIFLMTWLVRLPVNTPALWGGILAVPAVLDWRGVLRRLVQWGRTLAGLDLRTLGERTAFGALIFILLMHWVTVLKPEISADGLAMHLAVPMNVAAHSAMTYEPSRFLWSVMPMGADWIYTIHYLLGGEAAARLFNFAMLLVIETLLYGLVRRWVPRAFALLLAAAFAATPMVQLVTGSLFVENLLAALILGAVVAATRLGESGENRFFHAAAALAGTALAVKLGALAFLLVLLPVLALEARRWRKTAAAWVLAGALLLAAALPTYAIAWRKTGNPLFPFLNTRIHSPLLLPKTEIEDFRFRAPLKWSTLYDLTFATTRYYEGQKGSFGFQYLVMAPLGLLGALALRRRAVTGAAAIAIGASLLLLWKQPNARYLYPALPLISVPFAALAAWALAHERRLYATLVVFLAGATALNAWFLPTSSYYHKDFAMPGMFHRGARESYLGEVPGVRKAIQWFEAKHAGAPVLLTQSSDIAGLTGEVYANHWHQYRTVAGIERARNVAELQAQLESWHVRYFIARVPQAGERVFPPVLASLLNGCTAPEYEYGGWYVARLDPPCRTVPVPVVGLLRFSMTVSTGSYDDFHPAMAFRGDWEHNDQFEGPERHTISYTAEPGAEAAIAFEGRSITWAFTQAPNRGLAEVTVDGASQGVFDLYAPKVQWQVHRVFCCFGPGRHEARIRALGRRNPQSTGDFVDVDSLTVR